MELDGCVNKALFCAVMYPVLEVGSRVIPVGSVGKDLAYCREYVKGSLMMCIGEIFESKDYVGNGISRIKYANENLREANGR